MDSSILIIGPGWVGTTLGVLLNQHHCSVNALIARDPNQCPNSEYFANATLYQGLSQIECLDFDYILITTPDNHLKFYFDQLEARISKPTVVFHCSGALPAFETKNTYIHSASCHPLNSFSDIKASIARFQTITCALDGTTEAKQALTQLLTPLGCSIIEIESKDKTLWHMAAVLICNGFYGLLHHGLELYQQMGINQDKALAMLQPMLEHALNRSLEFGPSQALTGPIERGDDQTIDKHLQALGATSNHMQALYPAISQALISLSESKGQADTEGLDKIKQMLAEVNP